MKNKYFYFILCSLLHLAATSLFCSMPPVANGKDITTTSGLLKGKAQTPFKQPLPNTKGYLKEGEEEEEEETDIGDAEFYLKKLKKTNPELYEYHQKNITKAHEEGQRLIADAHRQSLKVCQSMNKQEEKEYLKKYEAQILNNIKTANTEKEIALIADIMVEAHHNIAENDDLGESTHQRLLKQIFTKIRQEEKCDGEGTGAHTPLTKIYTEAKDRAGAIIQNDEKGRIELKKATEKQEKHNNKTNKQTILLQQTSETAQQIITKAAAGEGMYCAASGIVSGWKWLIGDKTNEKLIHKTEKNITKLNKKRAELLEENEKKLNPNKNISRQQKELLTKLKEL